MQAAELARWVENVAWSEGHAQALAALDARALGDAVDGGARSHEERWPERAVVEGWLDAALRHAVLTWGEGPRLTPRHAHALAEQLARGHGFGERDEREHLRAKVALLAALVGDFDLAVRALGGAPPASRVSARRAPTSLEGLVRHVATVARRGLGDDACASALRGYASSTACEPVVFWALALLSTRAGGFTPSEGRARAITWLEAAEPAPGRARMARRPAPTDDPRVSIFENFMLVLVDPAVRTRLEWEAQYHREAPPAARWSGISSFVATCLVFGFDDLLEETRDAWLAPNPRLAPTSPVPEAGLVLRAALGEPVEGWREQLVDDLTKFHSPRAASTLRRYRWSTEAAAVALVAEDVELVESLVQGRKGAFRPALRLGDEPRVVLAYFAQALRARALGLCVGRSDVQPAWEDLVASRVPSDGEDPRTGGAFGWVSFFCLAFSLFHTFGGAPPSEVPGLLRATLRGERDVL
jgi:hypothetical protein